MARGKSLVENRKNDFLGVTDLSLDLGDWGFSALGIFEAQRPAGKLHLARDLNHRSQSAPPQRHRMATPKRAQIDAMPMERGNHS
jgi:hypothetical protein